MTVSEQALPASCVWSHRAPYPPLLFRVVDH